MLGNVTQLWLGQRFTREEAGAGCEFSRQLHVSGR